MALACGLWVGPAARTARAETSAFNAISVADPGPDLAARLLGLAGPVQVTRQDGRRGVTPTGRPA